LSVEFEFTVNIKSSYSSSIILLASLILCQSRYNLDDNVIIGIVDEGRNSENINSIGLYSNILPLLINFDTCGTQTIDNYLNQIRHNIQNGIKNSVSYMHIMDIVKPMNNVNNNQNLCQIMFVDQRGIDAKLKLEGCEIEKLNLLNISTKSPKYDFLLELHEPKNSNNNNEINCVITYNNLKFDSEYISQISENISIISKTLSDKLKINNQVNSISIISEKQKQLFNVIQRPKMKFESERVENIFTEIAIKNPNHIAIQGNLILFYIYCK
jgi:hypothetical protein